MRTSAVSRGLAALFAGVALAGTVVGCSSVVDGNARTEGAGSPTNGERSVKFNPCTELSADALRAIKVDPSSKDIVTDPPTGPAAWRICQWSSTEGPYLVSVASSTRPQEDVRSNDTVTDFQPVTIGARSGLTYRDKTDPDKLRCYVSLPSQDGMFNVVVGWRFSERKSITQAPPCDLAVLHAKAIEPFLPK
ncbi:Protein of unknown function (DUF3558) [Nocardia amikacinitolerans]|uniref:DUF3558 domain-containing protein n=1 Tax=Nocardia amikacinitolerans TaxID=756689 RepID=UPI0008342113|nr:DUF3558 domain-containing protein [Nocardia amikacinitolerans]MCP2320799.1 Protein of unknown function (DUF3558) [Nocardia amikacinitolerans]